MEHSNQGLAQSQYNLDYFGEHMARSIIIVQGTPSLIITQNLARCRRFDDTHTIIVCAEGYLTQVMGELFNANLAFLIFPDTSRAKYYSPNADMASVMNRFINGLP